MQRLGVTACGGEVGEPDDVGEHDRALDWLRRRRRGCRHHTETSCTDPLTLAIATDTSSPGSKLLCTVPRPDDRTAGRTPDGRRIVIDPETVLAFTGPPADEATVTIPLTERTWTAPTTPSTPMEPELVEISA